MQLEYFRLLSGSSALLGALTLSACIPPSPEPTPAPTSAPIATPSPTPAPVQPIASNVTNWMDMPATAGDWTYSEPGGMPFAAFGYPGSSALFALRCDRAQRIVALARLSSAQGPRAMQIHTETETRELRAEPQAGTTASALAAHLPAADSFFDAMAFSRGRFAVQVAGEPTLYLPAYPEVTRVVEECRR